MAIAQDAVEAPRLTSVQPAPVVGSTERQWITLRGSGFAEGFTVRLRADTLVDAYITDRARLTFVSPEEVRVKASVGTEAAAWSAQYIAPDSSAVSNAHPFQVAAPAPQIDEIRPAQKVAGGLGFDLAVYGRTLTEDSQIRWNGTPYPTTPIYSSDNPEAFTIGLKAPIPASAIASPGEQAVTVYTPAPGGGTSAPWMLRVAARPLYQTPWFYLLCIAGIVLAGGGLHWLRERHLRQKVLEKKVEQRTEQFQREKRKTEAQARALHEQAERLRELDRAKSRFFENLSHEFRTPLTLILGPLHDLLRRRRPLAAADSDGSRSAAAPLSPKEWRQLEGAAQQARHLQGLIEQLLTLARLDADRMPLDRRRLDLVPLVQGAVRSLQPLAEREAVALRFTTAASSLPVWADAKMLRRVAGNLISNAIKFTPEGGAVTVTLAEAGADAVLQVRDTGIGIPEEDLPRVFDRFYQAGTAAEQARAGTGIGLALAQELVERHGGTIRAESTPGEGATFTVTLPLAGADLDSDAPAKERAGAAKRKAAPPSVPAPAASGRAAHLQPAPAGDGAAEEIAQENSSTPGEAPTVLVVEDNDDVRAYVRDCLAACCRVREAQDGAEALKALRAERPDLVVSDVRMPGLDGTELVRRIREDEALADLPVILLTARAGEAERVGGLGAGADDYVEKPFSAEELRARVRGLIASRAGLRARYGRRVTMEPTGVSIRDEDEAFYEEARAAVEAHLGDPDFGVRLFAEAVGGSIQSRSQLTRRLKAVTGMTPAQFIRHLRMERAAQLLGSNPRLRVYEVADKVGYRDAEAFSARFREHFGASPSQYPPEDDDAASDAK